MMHSLIFALVFVAAVIGPVFLTMRTRASEDQTAYLPDLDRL